MGFMKLWVIEGGTGEFFFALTTQLERRYDWQTGLLRLSTERLISG